MKNLDFDDIKQLAEIDPEKALRLHWEGGESGAEWTTPSDILAGIDSGEFTAEEFDEYGYCCTEEDYQGALDV